MSCPLSAILNEQDGAPRSAPPNTGKKNEASQLTARSEPTLSTRDLPITPTQSSSPVGPRVGDDAKIPLLLSPERGSLYYRRRRRAQDGARLLPSPPRSDFFNHLYKEDTPSPPSHGSDPDEFDIFHALLNHPELTFEMTKQLDIEDLISLYAISRDFHSLANSRFTTMILGQSLSKAPESSRTFLFRCYRNLCLRDPARRLNEARDNSEIRLVPSFRWLRMVVFRESVVDDIIACLEKEGLMLPRRASLTIKKMWFTIDIADNARRQTLGHNRDFWRDEDLYLATLFIMKLDMLLTDPMTGDGRNELRKMLLGQRSLSTLAKVLKREAMLNQYEMMKMRVQWDYQMSDRQLRLQLPLFRVPFDQIGKLQYEGWGAANTTEKFIQIDEIIMGEAVRRGLDLTKHYFDMVVYGFVDPRTGADIWTAEQKRRREEAIEQYGNEDGQDDRSDASSLQDEDSEDLGWGYTHSEVAGEASDESSDISTEKEDPGGPDDDGE